MSLSKGYTQGSTRCRSLPTAGVFVFAVAVVGFALTAHREEWWIVRYAFLLLSGTGLLTAWLLLENPSGVILGEARLPYLPLRIVVVSSLGFFAAAGYRLLIGDAPILPRLCWFAVPAVTVGFTEEILWRGWIQGALSPSWGALPAVFVSTLSHTLYKTALFVFPPEGISASQPNNLALLAFLTFGGGLGIGFLRVRQGSVAGPVVCHMVFDLFVYGDRAVAPWWVC